MSRLLPVLAAIVVGVAVALAWGDPYLIRLLTQCAIYAAAALGLHMLVQLTGLASFGHGAFLAIGAYVGGVLMLHGLSDGPLLWLASLASGLVCGAVIGAFCLRTRGLYFLMATLAFAQMVYIGLRGLRSLGADDGFRLPSPPTLPLVGPLNATVFLIVAAIMLAAIVQLHQYLEAARIGAIVRATRDQPRQAAALGYRAGPYRLTIFAISAAIVALSGTLHSELMRYVGPGFGSWESSGQLLIMAVLGGGTGVIGPIVGAFGYILLEEGLTGATRHWPFFLGTAILARVLADPMLRRVVVAR